MPREAGHWWLPLASPWSRQPEDQHCFNGGGLCSGEGLGSGQGLGEFSAWHAAHSAHSGLPASRRSSHTPAGQTSSQGLGEGLGEGLGSGEGLDQTSSPSSPNHVKGYG